MRGVMPMRPPSSAVGQFQALASSPRRFRRGFAVVQQAFNEGDEAGSILSSWRPDFEPFEVGSMRNP